MVTMLYSRERKLSSVTLTIAIEPRELVFDGLY